MKTIAMLRQEKAAKIAKGKELFAQLDASDLTDDQKAKLNAEYEANDKALDAINLSIVRAEKLAEEEKTVEASATIAGGTNEEAKITVGVDKSKIFSSFGEFMQNVAIAGMPDNKKHAAANEKLQYNAAASGVNTTEGPDGGFLVRKDFSTVLIERAQEQSVILPLCTQIPVGDGFDGVELPYIDETSRATGSRFGGIQIYRAGETDSVTAKKPKLGKHELKLEDLRGLAYVSERALQDATSLGAILETAFGSEFSFVIDNEIIRGTGAGECLGILNGAYAGTVSVNKETGQAANTIVYDNVTKMRSRIFARSRSTAVWLINQDAEPALQSMSIPVGTGGVPVYLPAGGASVEGFDTLFGRPVIPVEQCETLGTSGDIVLADFSKYAVITKGGLAMDQSMHVRFIYHEMAFRFSYRINGQPLVKQAITPFKGSATQSAFVKLATRS